MLFEHGVRVTDVGLTTEDDGTRRIRRIRRLHVDRAGQAGTCELGSQDYVFLTLGSMSADAAYGDDDHAPELSRDKRDGTWRLLETIAAKADDFGHPRERQAEGSARRPLPWIP